MLLFLRNYQKRAVAKISEPIDFKDLIQKSTDAAPEAISYYCAHHMQKTFDLETKQVTGPKLKSRRALLTKIVENPRMRQKIRQIADQGGLKFEAAEKRTFQYLREIASDIHFTYIELWDYFLTWLFHTLYDGLEVDEVGLARLKKVAKDSPLILVPSHKSHIDYMLMSYVFYEYDLSLPHVCAGINLSFWPMGSIFRKSGGYFIRRSMPGDPLYPLALKSYVQELMREGYFQEFFIEGTRSRSGKLFPPKMGLLSMMIESFIEDGIEDVYFVPISIGYERIIEESSYLKEIKGAKKKKERFTDLLSLPKFLKRRYGKIYLQFAEPLSLKSLLAKEGKSLLQDPSAFKDLTKDFAQNICMAINEVTVLLPSPLVAIALLSHREKSITRDEIHEKVAALLNVAQQNSARLSRSLRKDAHFAVEEVLEQFVKEGLVRVHEDFQESFYTVPEESRSHLDFFKNKGIHIFAKPGIYQLCLRRSKLTPIPRYSDTPTLFKATHDLLSKEFFFSPEPIPPGPLPDWMGDLVLPILESYWLTLQAIQRVDFEKIEEKALNRKVLELGETLKLRGSLQYAESLSRFSIQNAVHKFIEMDILKTLQAKTGPSGQHFYAPGHDMEKRREVEQLLKVLLGR
jgi:glycerol-3-phosphate O-acyltransferase